MRTVIFQLTLSIFLFSHLTSCGQDPLPPSGTVKQEQFKRLMQRKDIQVIDVRTQGEFKAGHIANAANIDVEENDFMARMNKYDKSKAYLLYCQGGFRSAAALDMLQKAGFQHVYDLENGLGQWAGKLER